MLIKLRYADDLLIVLVNINFIVAVESEGQGSLVCLTNSNTSIHVVESPEEIYELCTKI